MIAVIASIQIKDNHLQEFVGIFKSNIPKVLEEKECTAHVPTIDIPIGLSPSGVDCQWCHHN